MSKQTLEQGASLGFTPCLLALALVGLGIVDFNTVLMDVIAIVMFSLSVGVMILGLKSYFNQRKTNELEADRYAGEKNKSRSINLLLQ